MLGLDGNQISSQGAWHLAKALETNRVKIFFSRHSHTVLLLHLLQSLIILYLQMNRLHDEGAIHLAHALQINSVKSVT